MSLLLKEKNMNIVKRWAEYTLFEISNNIKPQNYAFEVGKFKIDIIIEVDNFFYDNDICMKLDKILLSFNDRIFLEFLVIKEADKNDERSDDKDNIEVIITNLEEILTSKYVFCKYCEKPILEKIEKDLCKECYVNEYEHDEECSICKETGKGYWIQYEKCKHIFHFKCHQKIKGQKCPLCRGECWPYKNYFGEEDEE